MFRKERRGGTKGVGECLVSQRKVMDEKENMVDKKSKIMVWNPWGEGKISVEEFFERNEVEDFDDGKDTVINFFNRQGKTLSLNHIRYNSIAYQFLWFDPEKGYSSQCLFYRKQRGKNKWQPIAIGCHIPNEYLLVVADAFEKGGMNAAKYNLGI